MNSDQLLVETSRALRDLPSIAFTDLAPNTTLVIIDMLKGFTEWGALASPRIMAMSKPIGKLAAKFAEAGYRIAAFTDQHHADSAEFQDFPEHCLEGTREAELINELTDLNIEIIRKNCTNGLVVPGVWEKLTVPLGPDDLPTFVVVGCCTDICIFLMSVTLKAKMNQENIAGRVIVPTALVDTYDAPGHNAEAVNQMALYLMQVNGVELVKDILI
ncbi:MAG: cysteine hydrolase family protein [Chitinophagales bacterium]